MNHKSGTLNILSAVSRYQFGYRGIVYNLVLLILIGLLADALGALSEGVYFENRTSKFLTILLVSAFLAEPWLFYRRFSDVCAERRRLKLPDLAKSDSGVWLFVLLLFNAVVAFFTLMLAAKALGLDVDDEQLPGLIGFLITIRFLAMLFTNLHATEAGRHLEPWAAFRNDIGIALYTTVVYTCVWQTMVMRGFRISGAQISGIGDAAALILGIFVVVAIWLLPLRAVHFLEEWWSRPGRGANAAILITLAMLIAEVAFDALV